MKLLYFVRHGSAIRKDVLDEEDLGLDVAGKKQAKEAANYLKEKPLHKIYSSPLRRALETALIIKGMLRIPLLVDNRLSEYSYGDCRGKSFEEVKAMAGLDEEEGLFFAREAIGKHRFTSYEKYESVTERVLCFLKEAQTNSVVVTHGEVIRTIKAYSIGDKGLLEKRKVLEVDNGEVFEVVVNEGKIRVESIFKKKMQED